MSNIPDDAVAMFNSGYNCAQSVLACCGAKFGLPRETAIKVAQAFGGGMGRSGSVCGAVTGALMVIGLKHYVKDASDTAAKKEAGRLAQEFFKRFKARHKSLLCKELLGVDMSTDEGFRLAHSGPTKSICPTLIKDAAEIIEDLLNSEK